MMTIDTLLENYPPTNPHWANEVGFSFIAEDVDLNEDGWKDPWGNPISQSMFSPLAPGVHETLPYIWFEQHVMTIVGDTLVKLCVYSFGGENKP